MHDLRRFTLTLMIIAIVGCVAVEAKAVLFNDGLLHIINDNTYDAESVFVEDGPGNVPTTVIVNAGATIGVALDVSDTSVGEITGGTITESVFAGDFASIDMSGGSVLQEFAIFGNATANVSGGFISDPLSALDNSVINLSGGSIGTLFATNGIINVTGGILDFLGASGVGIINIFGDNFNFAFGEIPVLDGDLDGTLASGQSFVNLEFDRDVDAKIILHQAPIVPEPSTLTLAALAFFGLLAHGRRRRRA